MVDNKIRLCITLPGRVLYSEQECSENPQLMQHFMLSVEDNKGKKETLHVHIRKCKQAQQVTNISRQAYEYMISENARPKGITPGHWKKLSLKERLEVGLKEICESYGGISYTYVVLKD